MTDILTLKPRERVLQDGEAIAVLYRDLGTVAAERVVTQALAELATAMTRVASQVRQHQLADLAERLCRLEQMADELGIISLGLVAADARTCLARADSTGFAAVWARLLRIAERSLPSDNGFFDQTL